MEQRKNAADRVRPILALMERSIDAARRERTQDDLPQRVNLSTQAPVAGLSAPVANRPNPTQQRTVLGPSHTFGGGASTSAPAHKPQNLPTTLNPSPASTGDRERLKARPKRPAAFLNNRPYPDQTLHSRAV
jgi:hypothetical protein